MWVWWWDLNLNSSILLIWHLEIYIVISWVPTVGILWFLDMLYISMSETLVQNFIMIRLREVVESIVLQSTLLQNFNYMAEFWDENEVLKLHKFIWFFWISGNHCCGDYSVEISNQMDHGKYTKQGTFSNYACVVQFGLVI